MRKFKFMSKAVVGMMAIAMTMGSLSGVAFSQPMAIYAAVTSITVDEEIAEGGSATSQTAGATINLKATFADSDDLESETLAWESSDTDVATVEADTQDSTKATVTIAADAAKDAEATITVYYKKDDANNGKSATYAIKVVEKSVTPDPGTDDEEYSMDAFVDAGLMTLTVQTNDPYFTVDVLKTASDTEKPSKSYTYANNDDQCVIIDLGFLKVKKGNILNVYGSSVTDKRKGTIVTTEAQPAKEKITVDATKTSLAAAIGKTTPADAEKYQYTSSFRGDWYDLDNLDFEAAKVAGTTIIIRLKAVDTAAEGTTAAKSTPAGPEIKVKIPAAPKAPKVTVDYTKGTVKVTDKMQIALLPADGPVNEATGWKTAKKSMTRKEIAKELLGDENSTAAFTMVVRTAASGKKSASMPVIVPIKDQPTLAYTDATKKDSVTVTVGTTTATLKATRDKDGGLTFAPTGGTFQYEDGGKWKTVTSKLIKNFSSDKVKVRLAGVKTDKNTPNSGSFESTELELEVPKPAETPTTPADKEKATAPTAGDGAGEVKVGADVVLTISRDETTATTIKFETATDQDAVVATLEYRVGTTGDFAPIPATLENQLETELTIEVRVKATTDKDASDSLSVKVAAKATE